MKKTTYIIIALILSNFIIITIFFNALHTTGRPRASVYDYPMTEEVSIEEENPYSVFPVKIIVECNGKYYLYINQGFEYDSDLSETYNEATITKNAEDLLIHLKEK